MSYEDFKKLTIEAWQGYKAECEETGDESGVCFSIGRLSCLGVDIEYPIKEEL